MTVLDVRPLPPRPRRHQAAVADTWDLPLEGCAPTLPAHHPFALDPVERMRERARAVVQVLVEVQDGYRPLTQLHGWATPRVHDEIEQRLAALGGVRPYRPGSVPRARIASVHVGRPAEDAAEVAARIVQGQRSRALAVRLEARHDRRQDVRWICTVVRWG